MVKIHASVFDCSTFTQGEVMANHIVNDRGETVLAVGAPGSIERLKVEHPKLISELTEDNFVEVIKATDFSLIEIQGLINFSVVREALEGRLQDLLGKQLDRPNDLTWEEVGELYLLNLWL